MRAAATVKGRYLVEGRLGVESVSDGALSPAEARRLTDEVKRDVQVLWAKLLQLLRLYEGGAHFALGYPSWAAYAEAELGVGKSHGYRLLDAGRVVAAIETHSPKGERLPMNEAQARELVPVLRDEGEVAVVEVWRELRERYGEKVTAEKVRIAVEERLGRERLAALFSSEHREYYTPARYVDAARKVLGGIDLDPASCAFADATVRAGRFFTAADDGLAQSWHGRVWLNPPYGGLAGPFVEKLLGEYAAGRVEAAIALLNGYRYDATWFRALFAYPICFVQGRIDFATPAGASSGSTHGSVFVYVGPAAEAFAEVFSAFGAVVRRWPS